MRRFLKAVNLVLVNTVWFCCISEGNKTTPVPGRTPVTGPTPVNFEQPGMMANPEIFTGMMANPEISTGVPHVVSNSSLCSQFYNETFLPKNQSVEMAHNDMHAMGPLVNTNCSLGLLPLLCSIHLPKCDETKTLGLQPCRGFCESVKEGCSNASTQLKLPWPKEMRCSDFPASGKCFNYTNPKLVPSSCASEKVGTVEASGIFSWPETEVGSNATISCPYNRNVSVTRECLYKDNSFREILWGPVESKNCPFRNNRSQGIFELSQKNLNPSNVIEVNRRTKTLSSPGENLASGDVANIATILENIVAVGEKVDEIVDDFLSTVDNVLDASLQNVLQSQGQTNSSLRIVAVLNTLLEAINITEENNFFQRTLRNYAVHLSTVDPRNFPGVTFSGIVTSSLTAPLQQDNILKQPSDTVAVNSPKATTLRLPRTLFNDSTSAKPRNQSVIFALYKETKFFQLTEEPRPSKSLNSFVIAGSIDSLPILNLKRPVVITLASLQRGNKTSSLCSFWNFTQGNWSQQGCSFQGVLPDGRIVCHCDHLTNFAVLMDIYPDEETSHDRILGVISYVGCVVSLVGVVLTIITILLLSDIRRKVPGQILLNFCIALSLTLIVFLAAAERSKTSSMTTCRAAAVALHYFLLVAFMWMAIEAFNMYLLFVKVMPTYFSKFILKCCIVAWGIPAVIVSITMGVALEDYGGSKYCRLHGVPFLVSFLAPVLLILVGNSIAFVLIFRSLLLSGNKLTAVRKHSGLLRVRQGAAILVLLGLTWLFGVLAIGDAKLVFQYLFCIFNSFQGLLLFVFYCVLPEESRKKYKSLWRKKTLANKGGKRKPWVTNVNLGVDTPNSKEDHAGKSHSETNGSNVNTSENPYFFSSSQSSDSAQKVSSFEISIVEARQDMMLPEHAEDVKEHEIAFPMKEEIVLKIPNLAFVEYTVNGESHYVTFTRITLKNNATN